MHRLLITCPPMLGAQSKFLSSLEKRGFDVYCPRVTQTLAEHELVQLVPSFDAWIIGDDPATELVLAAGSQDRLKVAIKWGVGVDNVDIKACKKLGIAFENTPHMFGDEVADIALGYVIGLARETFFIDRAVRAHQWPKPRGISLTGKAVGVVGYGDIGRATATRLQACDMDVVVYDPAKTESELRSSNLRLRSWPEKIEECDFLIFTCALTETSRHMLNATSLGKCRDGVRIVNVARGPIIDERALIDALHSGKVHSAALDVFEAEPLPRKSLLREFPLCIFGTHNGSNTEEAVLRASWRAIALVEKHLGLTTQ